MKAPDSLEKHFNIYSDNIVPFSPRTKYFTFSNDMKVPMVRTFSDIGYCLSCWFLVIWFLPICSFLSTTLYVLLVILFYFKKHCHFLLPVFLRELFFFFILGALKNLILFVNILYIVNVLQLTFEFVYSILVCSLENYF